MESQSTTKVNWPRVFGYREPWRRYLVFIRPLSTAHPNSIDDRDLASAPHRHTHWCQVLQGLIVTE
jgi:hypothetical protein